jgi:hypothetical protein
MLFSSMRSAASVAKVNPRHAEQRRALVGCSVLFGGFT